MAVMVVDNLEINFEKKTNLLKLILDNGIYVPNLCYLHDMEKPHVSCRLCFVEIEGQNKPVPSCAIEAEDGMIIRTDTPDIRRLRKTAFELLLSVHRIECKICPANRKCELQKIAKFLHVPLKQKRIEFLERGLQPDDSNPFIKYDPDKCVMCAKCVNTCKKLYDSPYLSFAKRGLDMTISFFGETDPDKIPCGDCYACVDVCPVAALLKKYN
jgi:bidirectional [NiFe] hydrogenase diaphorase subunit